MSLMLEVLQQALPEVPLDRGVSRANTGNPICDTLPLLTMLPCLWTLQLHWRRGRRADLFLFSIGFALAVIYHWLHMHPQGIAHAQLLGISGATWRGLDILMAQALLSRTLGHALNAHTAPVRALSNVTFPAVLLGYAHLLSDGVLTLTFASKVLVLVLLATLAAKGALEGWGSLPQYCPRRGKRSLACFALGFAVFPLPELFPTHYWLLHSIWHLLMAEGYHHLYVQLEGLAEANEKALQRAERPATARAYRAAGRTVRREASSSGGEWAQSLLQPWQRFMRYQAEQAHGALQGSH